MKQKFTLLLAVMLMAFCGNSAWAQNWTKASSVEVGDEVILVYEAGKLELSDFGKTKYGSIKTYTDSPQGLYPLTVVVGANGANFALKHDDGKGNVTYLNWHNGNNLYEEKALDAKSSWTIAFDKTTGDVLINNVSDGTRVIQFGNSDRFACYKSTQKNIQLYKRTGDPSKQDQSLSFVGSTDFIIIVGETFTAPKLTGASTDVTYESSDVKVATVDPSTGAVTLAGGIGTTTITASAAADATHNAASASYTLTVNPAPKYVTNIAEFLAKPVDKNVKYTFKNPVVVVKQHSDDLWVKDASGYVNVHGSVGQTYNMGDEIPAGFSGVRGEFKSVPQLGTAKGFLPATKTGLTVEPVEKAITALSMTDINSYVVVKNVTVDKTKKTISDGTNTFATYEKFSTAKYPEDQNRYDVIGIVNHYNNLQLLPMEIVLHKDENLKNQTLKFAQEKYVAVLADKTFQAELTGAMTTVTYTSSNAKVATVDANGLVTLVGTGITTITASAAADATYNADIASYELSVESAGAILPLNFDGGKAQLSADFVAEKLGSDYKSSPKLKFDQTGSTLTLKLSEAPGTLGYTIKQNGENMGEFTIYTSTDGVDFEVLKKYTKGDMTQNQVNKVTFDLKSNVRYIRWEATVDDANVAIGAISVSKAPTSYNVTLTSAGYATFAANHAYVMPDGLQGGIVTVANGAAKVDYMYTAGDVVAAKEALLINGAEGQYTLNITAEEGVHFAENQLKGAFTNAEIKAAKGNEIFVLAQGAQGLGFYWQKGRTDGAAVSGIANKAYLELPIAAGINGLRLVEGDATGIEGVETANEKTVIYNLAGVRVNADRNNLPQGLYIINGKKVFVK